MLRISKLTDYAIVAMTTMAGAPTEKYSATELASQTHLEATTVAKILKLLSKAGLVESFRGAHGGYRLARAPAAITMVDIITAMEGPIGMTECTVHAGACAQEPVCTTRTSWQRISNAIESALNEISLAQMALPARVDPLRVTVLNR